MLDKFPRLPGSSLQDSSAEPSTLTTGYKGYRLLTPKEFLAYAVSICLIGGLILAFIDPAFRPQFGEILKAVLLGSVLSNI